MKKVKKTKKLSLGKKYFPTFISSIPHQKNVFTKAVALTIFISVSAFLLLNMIFPQMVNPAYFQIMNDNENSAIYYLQSIQHLPQFSSDYLRFKNIYGERLENTMLADKNAQIKMMQQFEQILVKNPYSRDILYSLFLIYERLGNKNIAQEYLRRAKEIDPSLEMIKFK